MHHRAGHRIDRDMCILESGEWSVESGRERSEPPPPQRTRPHYPSRAACAAANRATGTRNGEQLT